MKNVITIELCQEDRKRLDELIAFAGLLVGEIKSRGPVTMQTTEAPKAIDFIPGRGVALSEPEQPAPEINHPADILPPHGDPEPAAEPEKPKYTKDDIQAKVRKLAAPGSSKRLEAKAIVQAYAAKVSDIPADKYDEVMAKLIELEG